MPESKAPYKRGWKSSQSRGRAQTVNCAMCGRKVPRHKSFVTYRGFHISDPLLRKELDKQQISGSSQKEYICPKCARYLGVVQKGKNKGQKQTRH